MSASLSFELKDRYTTKIWNPKILNPDEEIKSLNGEYFFSVLYSVHREKHSKIQSVAQLAKKTLAKFLQEIESFENDINTQIRMVEFKKSECVFNISFSSPKTNSISFSPLENSGVCPENAAFLRAFINLDKYVSMLGEIFSMAVITEKEYYIQRKTAQSKMRGIMEGYNNLIKRFHTERKKSDLKSVAVA